MTDAASERPPPVLTPVPQPLSLGGRAARRFRNLRDRLRPIPTPNYTVGTPKIGGQFDPGLIQSSNLNTLREAAMSADAHDAVTDVLERLTAEKDVTAQHAYYALSMAQFGKHWQYADLAHVLWAASTLTRPASYLEIGVMRGRSAAIVGSATPDCDIYGFDLWPAEYAGVPNPGPDFVRSELRTMGHRGKLSLVSGDSGTTVAKFLRERPDLYFDIILVDGGKSVLGVANDYANTLPRLKVGGIVLTDDLALYPTLRRVWRKFVQRDSRYMTTEIYDVGYSVALGIRVSDEPLFKVLSRSKDAPPNWL